MLGAVVYLSYTYDRNNMHSYQVAYDFEWLLRTSVSCVKHGLPVGVSLGHSQLIGLHSQRPLRLSHG